MIGCSPDSTPPSLQHRIRATFFIALTKSVTFFSADLIRFLLPRTNSPFVSRVLCINYERATYIIRNLKPIKMLLALTVRSCGLVSHKTHRLVLRTE